MAKLPKALSATDFQVLLVLAAGDLYGYAILKAMEEDSGGAVRPEIGSLYRVLGRLMSKGWVSEVSAPPGQATNHRGQPRRYYHLTSHGHQQLESEARRLRRAVEIAEARALLPDLSETVEAMTKP